MSTLTVFTPDAARRWANCPRELIDGACSTGALRAADVTPTGAQRHWRILSDDLEAWVRAGMPRTPETNPQGRGK